LLTFESGDVKDFQPPDGPPGTILVNPPYGERLGEETELRPLYAALGETFQRCPGWRCWVFTGNGALARRIKLPVAERIHLFNGKLPCQLLRYEPA
jgi:putative N6-adenine-specific DNA methylase